MATDRIPVEGATPCLGTDYCQSARHATEDIEEFPLMLQRREMSVLIEAAEQLGTTAAALARRLIGDYLRQTGRTVP